MKKLLCMLSLICYSLGTPSASASPWTVPEGEAVVQLSWVGQRSTHHFTSDNSLESFPWGGKQVSTDYVFGAQYGVSNRIEVGAKLNYKYLAYTSDLLCIDQGVEVESAQAYTCPVPGTEPQSYESLIVLDTNAQLQGLSDLWLNTKVQLLQGPIVVAVSPVIKIPAGYEGPTGFLTGGTDDVSLGGGQIDAGAYVYVGGSLPGHNTFVKGALGYLHRFGDPGDQIVARAKIGYAVGSKSFIAGGLEVIQTVTPGASLGIQGIRIEEDGEIITSEIFYESDSLTADLTFIHRPQPKVEVVVSVFQYLYGSYIAASTGLSVGTLLHF